MKIKLILAIIFTWGASCFMAKANTGGKEAASSEKSDRSNSLFKLYDGASKIDVSKDISNAIFLELDYKELGRIYQSRPSILELTIPVSNSGTVTFNLYSKKILADNFKVTTSNNDVIKYIPGIYYQGGVAGSKKRELVGVSVFDNSLMAVFSQNGETYVLGLWDHPSNPDKNIYILYKDNDVKFARNFTCATESLPESQGILKSGSNGGNQVQSTNCIKIYFECDYQMFVDKGSAINVTNYVTGFYGIVQQLFNAEQVSTEISEIYVWTTTDPYISNATSSDYLNDFQATRTNFNGNLAHLLTTRNLGIGGVAYVDVICDSANAYGFSNIENTYAAYPNYSNTVLIVTHELGHNFGSKHTHWCLWPGGPIDNCVPVDGGPCTAGPSVAPNGGTIMSYCHLNVGTSLSNGFGPLPGNKIRTQYAAAATCLTSCDSPPDAQFTASQPSSCNLPQTITFTDASTFGTNAWKWDIDNNGTIDYTTQNPSHTYTVAGSYTVRLIATNANGSDTIIKTNFVSVGTVATGSTIAITSGTSAFCQGTSVTFTATPTNGGSSPAYQWYVNGIAAGGETAATFTNNTLTGNPTIACKITSNATCATPSFATSSTISLTITPNVTPEITIALNSGTATICTGTSVTFSSTIVSGGSGPLYQWKVGSTNVGTGTSFTSSSLANGDAVTCTLTSNIACASPTTITSNDITMTVSPVVTPTVAIALSSGTLPTCPGTPVTFTATATEGGTSPSFQWKKNGVNAFVGTSFTPVNPSGGDVITCVVTSNAECVGTATATSNSIIITLVSPTVPSVAVAATTGTNPICSGTSTTYTATPTNGGSTPVYQWLLNGFPITGAQSQTYIANSDSVSDGDVLSCQITSSGTCPQVVESNTTTLAITPLPTIVFLADIDVCAGNIPVTSITSNPPGASYTWTNSNTAIGLAASGTNNVPAFTTTNTGSAPITATVTVTPSTNGCVGTPDTYTITVNPTPEILQTNGTLTSTSASGYQWYCNGVPVTGATSQTHTAMQNGEYMVIVDGSDCPSESVTVTSAGIDAIDGTFSFLVYPNPNTGSFFVTFDAFQKNNYSLKIVNAVGALIYDKQLSNYTGLYSEQVAPNDIAKGVYLIYVSNGESEQTKKIIIY